MPKYDHDVVREWFNDNGLYPELEYRFAPPRKWRFDLAWPDSKVALEVQGGLFTGGRHSRGAALLKEHEKLNAAVVLGWRILYCIPDQVCMTETLALVEAALENSHYETNTI